MIGDRNDYLYLIYLLVLILFYVFYMKVLFVDHFYRFDSSDFDHYGSEIPRLLWFKKGYRSI